MSPGPRRTARTLIAKATSRQEIVEAALATLDAAPIVDVDLAADFLALGYAKLQVELLTRQMRYASNLDEPALERLTLAAADAALAGNADEARSQLQGAFNLLGDARKYFYPVDSYLLDLTLVAATTLGPALAGELGETTPKNLLLPAALVESLAGAHGATLAALSEALARGGVSLVGGEIAENELPLLPAESVLEGIERGLAEYRRVLDRVPRVFGRRRYGLSPALPQLLVGLGFAGALHFTLDDGRFPLGSQSKVRWEGPDGTAIEALARLPRDAAQSATFLDFAKRLGESMDTDHVASVILAHWPGAASPWYDDLRRAARYTSALGKFITLDDFFSETYAPAQTARFLADEYRTPYLKQSIIRREADPLSRTIVAQQQRASALAHEAVGTLAALVSPAAAPVADAGVDETLPQRLDRLAGLLAAPGASTPNWSLAVNPLSFARRMLVERPAAGGGQADPADATASAQSPVTESRAVEVPALGFAFVDWSQPEPGRGRRDKPLAADNVLANELFEITIHPTTGGIQVLRDYHHRGNRMSQQIALRTPGGAAPQPGEVWRDPDEDAVYSTMQAESIAVTCCTSSVGEITSRGSLVDGAGRRLAGFVQRTQVWQGGRVARIEVELDPAEELRADPWNSYYAARFAWSDSAADLSRGVQGACHPTEAKRIEAPEFIEIDLPGGRTAILTGGLPYHRRSTMRVIDSLLVVRGETRRRFTLGLGVDLANPAAAAAELIAPPTVVGPVGAAKTGASSGWLLHVDARSVLATHWAPLPPQAAAPDEGNPALGPGFRVRLLETSGRPVRAALRVFRPVTSARKVDFRGQTLGQLNVDGDRIVVDLAGYQWIEVEARW